MRFLFKIKKLANTASFLIFLLLAILSQACGESDPVESDGDSDQQADEEFENDGFEDMENEVEVAPDTTPPEIVSLSITGGQANPLSAIIDIKTDEPVTLILNITENGDKTWSVGPSINTSSEQEAPLLGLHAESEYEIVVSAIDAAGNSTDGEPLSFSTDPLPEEIPFAEVLSADTERVSDGGINLFSLYRWKPIVDMDWGYIIATDINGEVIFYYKNPGSFINEMRTLANGNMLFLDLEGAVELDMLGRTIMRYDASEMGMDVMHHSFTELPNGNIMVLGTELREIDGYTDDEGEEKTYSVVGDTIHEFTRTGEVVKTWSMFDYFDPYRTKEGFDGLFWAVVYTSAGLPKDWTHGNQIIYDERDNSMIISLCHQDWIAKISRDTDELVWRLGVEGDFELKSGDEWFYHQHAPELQSTGALMVYDNGDSRPLEEGEPNYSRVLEYMLDLSVPGKPVATQVWEYRGEDYYSPVAGAITALSNGNYLITDSSLIENRFAGGMDISNFRWSRITEINRDGLLPEVVYQMEIRDPEGKTGYTIYRTMRLKSLYNPAEWEI